MKQPQQTGLLTLLGALALFALSCAEAPSGGGNAFKVGLLTPGPVSDGGWNAGAYEALQEIHKQLGAEISNQQVATPADFEQGFRGYAQQGYALVFGHGFEFQDPAMRAAKDFPDTDFVVSSGSVSAKNVASLQFDLDQATYLAGMLAASLSKTGRAGCVGGIELPVIKKTFDGFIAGAKSVNPDFVVSTAYTGNFEDVAAARAAASAMIAQGADFLLHNADAAGLGVFQAAKDHGVLAFGSNGDQSSAAPDTVLASAVISIPAAFLQMAREAKEKRFEGRVAQEGLDGGVIQLVYNPRLEDRVPPEVKAKVAEAEERIREGKLQVKP
ncbi:MAG: BMP family protein [Candidatus Binatia bacterium]|nr:BMP family protein [Candidatus Binatia bacterium]